MHWLGCFPDMGKVRTSHLYRAFVGDLKAINADIVIDLIDSIEDNFV